MSGALTTNLHIRPHATYFLNFCMGSYSKGRGLFDEGFKISWMPQILALGWFLMAKQIYII